MKLSTIPIKVSFYAVTRTLYLSSFYSPPSYKYLKEMAYLPASSIKHSRTTRLTDKTTYPYLIRCRKRILYFRPTHSSANQCYRLGLVANYLTRVAQMSSAFGGYYSKCNYKCKLLLSGNFLKKCSHFYSIIWSHWSAPWFASNSRNLVEPLRRRSSQFLSQILPFFVKVGRLTAVNLNCILVLKFVSFEKLSKANKEERLLALKS